MDSDHHNPVFLFFLNNSISAFAYQLFFVRNNGGERTFLVRSDFRNLCCLCHSILNLLVEAVVCSKGERYVSQNWSVDGLPAPGLLQQKLFYKSNRHPHYVRGNYCSCDRPY